MFTTESLTVRPWERADRTVLLVPVPTATAKSRSAGTSEIAFEA
ncbi:hypothetical protein ACFV1W_22295 [Kitasatospora sp. NPDC059648]